MSAALSASLEDYLEAIYHIIVQKQAARAKDVSTCLNEVRMENKAGAEGIES